MVKELGRVFFNKLVAYNGPFLDVVAGTAETLTVNEIKDDNGKTIVFRSPTATVHNQTGCNDGILSLIPNSNRRSIIYFEDFGTKPTETGSHGMQYYATSLRLICWYNRKNLLTNPLQEISGTIINTLIGLLANRPPENIDIFSKLTVKVANVPAMDAALFGRYTYKETDRQYLRPPFEFFAIDLISSYGISAACINQIQFTNVNAC